MHRLYHYRLVIPKSVMNIKNFSSIHMFLLYIPFIYPFVVIMFFYFLVVVFSGLFRADGTEETILDSDNKRHREIIVKAISALLLLLLKHFKLNHIYQVS